MTTPAPSEIFTSYCNDLLAPADTVDDLFICSAIAITAWNNAERAKADIEQATMNLKQRLKIETISSGGRTLHVDDLVKKMADRKLRDFTDRRFKILKANFENEENRIRVNVEVAPDRITGDKE